MSTYDTDVTPINDKVMFSPCTHQRYATCVHSVHQSFENICVRTVDTDALVIAVTSLNEFKVVEDLNVSSNNFGLHLALVKVTALFLSTQLPVRSVQRNAELYQ